MTPKQVERLIRAIERIETVLTLTLDSVIDLDKRVLRMTDVERANVYKTHLGTKLRKRNLKKSR